MNWLALSLALATTEPNFPDTRHPPARPWRVVDEPCVHVGVRPAIGLYPLEVDVGATVQLTLNVL